jgi:hypothetical protein
MFFTAVTELNSPSVIECTPEVAKLISNSVAELVEVIEMGLIF